MRTYVRHGGRKGVWFFSLDTTNSLAVWAARLGHLAYFHADIRRGWRNGWCHYRSTRRSNHADRLAVRYRADSPVFQSRPGSLEEFLTERYYLFSADARGKLFCCKISHHRWRLHQARAEIEHNGLFRQLGLATPTSEPLQHFSYFQAVQAWPIVPVQMLEEHPPDRSVPGAQDNGG